MVRCQTRSHSEDVHQGPGQEHGREEQGQGQGLSPDPVEDYGRTHRGHHHHRHRGCSRRRLHRIHRRRRSCRRRRRRSCRHRRRHHRVQWAMGSRCAKLSTGHGTIQNTGHSRGHESSLKLVACMSQDNFSLSSEGEDEEEEQIPVKGKLLLMEPEKQESAEDDSMSQPSSETK